jgi:hypothetical protein
LALHDVVNERNFVRLTIEPIPDDDLEESITSQKVSKGVEEGVKIN